MEKIYNNKILLGILVKKFSFGTKAITLNSEPLQVVALKRGKGEATGPHLHANYSRRIIKTQSCFIVRKGKIRVDVYNNQKKLIRSLSLGAGDFYISLAGGHGIKYLTNAEVVEIKNGPFKEDKILIA